MAQLQKYAFRFGRALHVASLAQRPPHAHIYIYIYTHWFEFVSTTLAGQRVREKRLPFIQLAHPFLFFSHRNNHRRVIVRYHRGNNFSILPASRFEGGRHSYSPPSLDYSWLPELESWTERAKIYGRTYTYALRVSVSLSLENVNWNDDLHADSRTHNSLWTSSSCIPGVIMSVSPFTTDRSPAYAFGKQEEMIYSSWPSPPPFLIVITAYTNFDANARHR